MATNISYASSDTFLESLALHTLPDFGEHGDGIINNNFLLSMLKDNGEKGFRVIEGGLEFWNGVIKGRNTNSKWQGKTDDMSAQLQDPSDRFRYDIKVFTSSYVLNELDKARNKGKAMIKEWLRTLRLQTESTILNDFNSAFWSTAPGAYEPESIPSLISTTPDSGTVGGVSRSGNQYAQNGLYATAVSDIGSEAGISALTYNIIRRSLGSGGKDRVDTCITSDTLFGGLSAYLANNKRYRANEKMAQLKFDTILLGSTTIGYENTLVSGDENTIGATYIYGINRNHTVFKVLRDGNFKWGDEFERVSRTLNKAVYFYVFCNLCAELPKANFVMNNVSTT